MDSSKEIKLTEYSSGAGCGCKISPKVLESILQNNKTTIKDSKLIVGNETKDDAAVYDIGGDRGIVSTTDFFMPIVDDPYTFGKIASINAISDVYAMGGKPLMAISILGWPINKISAEHANQVICGARDACQQAGIALAGGHSIDSPEPIFGLSVTGEVSLPHIKKNSGAKANSSLFLTKPLGVGILATAKKKNSVSIEDYNTAINSMLKLNSIGHAYGELNYVNSITDVTGFGLLGHLLEVLEASNLNAHIHFDKIPLLCDLKKYIDAGTIPGGTNRNWDSYGDKISEISSYQRAILADPQTSGGLLVSVDQGSEDKFLAASKDVSPVFIGNTVIADSEIRVKIL